MKSIYFFSPLVLIVVVLTIVHVIVANMLSTAGVELDKIGSDLTKYKKQNTLLREQVLEQESLYYIASVAAKMGFVDAKDHVYVGSPLPLAKR